MLISTVGTLRLPDSWLGCMIARGEPDQAGNYPAASGKWSLTISDQRASGSMSEEEFKAGIYKSHQAHFDHVYRLHRIAQEAMLSYRHHVSTPYEDALSPIFARAYKSFDSIRRLCEIASCEDAAVILRSLLNLLVVTRWISIEPSGRSRKYLHIRDLFVQVGLEKQYEEGYRPLSGIEHSDARAFFAMVKDMERSGTERRLEVQSDLFIPHYLRNAFQYFGDIFEICNRTIPLTDAQNLKRIIAKGREFYKADMEAKGIPP